VVELVLPLSPPEDAAPPCRPPKAPPDAPEVPAALSWNARQQCGKISA